MTNTKIKWKHDIIIEKCKWKKILHLWACDDPYTEEKYKTSDLLHQKIMEVTDSVIWLDFSKNKITFLKNQGIDNIIYGDLIKGEYEKEIWNDFDYIIFWDVIEHLENPWIALNNIKWFMNENTILIVTTPNIFHYKRILTFFTWNEIVHEDHVFWPSKKTMDTLFKRTGFNIKTFKYTTTQNDMLYKNIKTLKWKLFFKFILTKKDYLLHTLFYELSIKKD